jgi:hypothetical protein
MWKMNGDLRRKIRRAMFGPGSPYGGPDDISAMEQSDLLSQFSKKVAGPIIETLPPHTAAWAVLMLYEEFVDAVFVHPAWDVGGGD